MNIAILGYGRQGKKHARFWKLIGLDPKVFTRFGGDGKYAISEFRPTDYNIIVCSIFPIIEQTQVLASIINSGYGGYLIIEKPITYDISLLDSLVDRDKTIFFIDEAYIDVPINMDVLRIVDLQAISSHLDNGAIQEHALGLTLRSNIEDMNYYNIIPRDPDGSDQYYVLKTDKYTIESKENTLLINDIPTSINFDGIYTFLFRNISNEAMMSNIRKNYKKVRNQFFGF